MALTTEFKPLELEELRREAAVLKADGWRFVQTHAVAADRGIDLYYTFMKDGHAVNYRIEGVAKGTPVPSITDLFLAAFVFENEARELFGVDMRDIAIDFAGALYAPAESEPMTFVTPEQKAAREKARKAAEAKPANAGQEQAPASGDGQVAGRRAFVMTPERQARLDKKMETMPEEKKAKVRAALAARAAEAAPPQEGVEPGPAKTGAGRADAPDARAGAAGSDSRERAAALRDAVLEKKIAELDASKAAKVRAALAGVAAGSVESPGDETPSSGGRLADEQLERLVGQMDDVAAARVRAALAGEGGE